MIPTDNAIQWLFSNFGFIFCHQIPGRSIYEGGIQLPVCSRDTGTMIGFLVVLALYYATKRYKRRGFPDKSVILFIFLSFILFAFDAGSSYLGFRETTNSFRLISGMALGASLGTMILYATSLFVKEAKENTRSFVWRDVLIIVGIIAMISFVILDYDFGIIGYYLIALAIILSYLILTFFMLRLFLTLLLNWKPGNEISVYNTTLTIVVEIIAMAILWLLHLILNGGLE
jgi:uncharacterized membrane protein